MTRLWHSPSGLGRCSYPLALLRTEQNIYPYCPTFILPTLVLITPVHFTAYYGLSGDFHYCEVCCCERPHLQISAFFLQHPLLQLKCNIAHDCKNDADSEKIENLCAMHEMKQNVESLNEAECVMKIQNRFPQRWKS